MEQIRLHIGGIEAKPGWKILNIEAGPGVDHVGNCSDLSRFGNGSIEEIYASHVLEHLGYAKDLLQALKEWHRVLKDGGKAMISVPDFEVLCRLFLDPARDAAQRFYLMRVAFGGQMDPHDFHYVGLTMEILASYLSRAGFSYVEQVDGFGLFEDTSRQDFLGTPISLNVIAWK
ncbi:MAG TPA: methyltransferase domain-containing protein [Burkholderiales bacterium]|nr:methyltransferase domain-containing protein [Burkholderiales bacterium]